MAPLHLISTIFIILFASLLIPAMKSETFSRKLSKKQMGLKKEKLTHLHFYFHDIHSGKNPTAIKIVDAAAPTVNSTTRTGFGAVFIMDNPLTVGPNLSSKSVGRAQGMYASAGIDDLGLLMVMNYNFVEGKYNGSTLSILGRNPALMPVREMPIVGGSGLFRYARGYAQAKTHAIDFNTGDACVEYNVYVFHY